MRLILQLKTNQQKSKKMTDLNNDQMMLKNRARELAEESFRPKATEVDQTEEYPWESIKTLNKEGFLYLF